MPREEGIRFLLYRSRQLDPASARNLLSPEDVLCAQELVTAMGGLPLALDQAGAYIDETGCGLMHYHTLYQTSNSALLDRRGYPGDYPHSVMMTLSISLQQVEARSPAAADLLRLCAFIDPDAIPEELFLYTAAISPAPISCLALDSRELDELLAILRCYSLIKRYSTTGLLSIHRLVQATLKAQMDPQTSHSWTQRAIEAVNCAFPAVEAVTTWAQCQRLLPHALICTTLIEEEHLISEDAEHLLRQMGNYLMEGSRYEQAEVCLLHAHEIFVTT
jgi:hypothetical protein